MRPPEAPTAAVTPPPGILRSSDGILIGVALCPRQEMPVGIFQWGGGGSSYPFWGIKVVVGGYASSIRCFCLHNPNSGELLFFDENLGLKSELF